jgi:hypothetical protein
MDSKGELLQQVEVTVSPEQGGRTFTIRTYGKGGAVNPDPYYQENMVLGDLPAGIYKITFEYEEKRVQTWVEIFPGQVSYFTFKGAHGFDSTRPPAATLDFVPLILPATPTPQP